MITSSQTLHLDPEGTVATAMASPWLAIGEVGLKDLRAGLKAAGNQVSSREDAHTPGELGKVSAKDVLPETLLSIVQAAGEAFAKPKAPFIPGVFIDPTVDELWEIPAKVEQSA